MSMIRCDQCSALIDTDENPETHCAESDQWICEKCRSETEAYWRAQYNAAPLYDRNPEQYRQEMREAGRGHLVDGIEHLKDRADIDRKIAKGE